MANNIETKFEWFTEDIILKGQVIGFYSYILPSIKEEVNRDPTQTHTLVRVYKDYVFRITTKLKRKGIVNKSYLLNSTVTDKTLGKILLTAQEPYVP